MAWTRLFTLCSIFGSWVQWYLVLNEADVVFLLGRVGLFSSICCICTQHDHAAGLLCTPTISLTIDWEQYSVDFVGLCALSATDWTIAIRTLTWRQRFESLACVLRSIIWTITDVGNWACWLAIGCLLREGHWVEVVLCSILVLLVPLSRRQIHSRASIFIWGLRIDPTDICLAPAIVCGWLLLLQLWALDAKRPSIILLQARKVGLVVSILRDLTGCGRRSLAHLSAQLWNFVAQADELVSDLFPRYRDYHVIRLIVQQELSPVYFASWLSDLVANHTRVLPSQCLQIL